jgi:hypothetical protein
LAEASLALLRRVIWQRQDTKLLSSALMNHLIDEPAKDRFVVTPMKGELHGSQGEPMSGPSWLLDR